MASCVARGVRGRPRGRRRTHHTQAGLPHVASPPVQWPQWPADMETAGAHGFRVEWGLCTRAGCRAAAGGCATGPCAPLTAPTRPGGGGCQACGRRLYIWLGQVHGASVAAPVARACRAPRLRAARGIRRPGRRLVATDGRGVRPRQAIHGQDLVARMRPLPSRPGGIAARRLPRGRKESIGRAARQLGGIYRPHRLCRMRAPPGAAGLGLKIDPLTQKMCFAGSHFCPRPAWHKHGRHQLLKQIEGGRTRVKNHGVFRTKDSYHAMPYSLGPGQIVK